MSDINFSLGFTTDTTGLKNLEREFDRLDKTIKKVSDMMNKPNIQTERYDKLKNIYDNLIKKLDLVTKAHGELDSMLKNSTRDGLSLERVFVQLGNAAAKEEKPLAAFINQLRQMNLAMQGANQSNLTSFLGRLDGALGQVTQAIDAQVKAMQVENELTEKNIRLKEAQMRATAESARVRREAAANAPVMEEEGDSRFGRRLFGAAQQAIITAPIYGGVYAATAGIQQSIEDYIRLDSILNRIAIVTGKTTDEVRAMREEFMHAGRELSTSAEEYARAAQTFYAQGGIAADHAKELATVSIQLANATGQQASDTADYVTAIGNSFKLLEEGEEGIKRIGDVLLYLDNASATSADEIGQAMRRSASSFEAAGIEYEKGAAMIATVSEITRQAPERVGTAFKTIVETIQEVKKAGPKEMREFTSKIQETIDDFPSLKGKLQLFDESGTQMVETKEFLQQLQSAFAEIKDTDPMAANAIAQAIGGKENANILAALLQNYDRFQELMIGIQTESLGAAERAQAEFENSLQARINKLKAAWEEFVNKLLSSKALENIITSLTKAVDLFGVALGESHQLFKLITAIVLLKFAPTLIGAFLKSEVGIVKWTKSLLNAERIAAKGLNMDTTKFRAEEEAARSKVELLTASITKQTAAIRANQAAQATATDPTRQRVLANIANSQATRLARTQAQLNAANVPVQALERAKMLTGGLKVAGAGLAGGALTAALTIGSAKMSGDTRSALDIAKGEAGNLIGGAVGGAIGALGGPIGMMLGSMVGSWAGTAIQESMGKAEKEIKKKNEDFEKNAETYRQLELKKRSNIELTTQEKDLLEQTRKALGEYATAVDISVSSLEELEKQKKILVKSEDDFSKVFKKEKVSTDEVTDSFKKLHKAREDYNLATAKDLMNKKLVSGLQSNQINIQDFINLSNQISAETSFKGLRENLLNYDIFKDFKDQFKQLETNAQSSSQKVIDATKSLIDNFGSLSSSGKISALKELMSAFGISDDIVDATKLNSDQILAMYQKMSAAATGQLALQSAVSNAIKNNYDDSSLAAVQQAATSLANTLNVATSDIITIKTGTEVVEEEKSKINLRKSNAEQSRRLATEAKEKIGKNKSVYIPTNLNTYYDPITQKTYSYMVGTTYTREQLYKKDKSETTGSAFKAINKEINKNKADLEKLNNLTSEQVKGKTSLIVKDNSGAVAKSVQDIASTETGKKSGTGGGGGGGGGTRKLEELQQITEKNLAADFKRDVESLNKQIKIIENGTASAEEKYDSILKLLDKKIVDLREIHKKYNDKLYTILNQGPLSKIKKKDGLISEDALQERLNTLEQNLRNEQIKLNNITDQSSQAYKNQKTVVDNTKNALDQFTKAMANYEDIVKQTTQSQDDLNQALEESKKKIIELREAELRDTLSKDLFGNQGVEQVKNYYSILKDYHTEYLDDIEKGIELNKISNKIAQDTLKYGSNPLLTDLQKKITTMKGDANKYSKTELNLLTAQYDMVQKQILLQQAQRQAGEVRLMRDSQGNWVYGAVSGNKTKQSQLEAQSALMDAQEKFYEEAKKALGDTQSKILTNSEKLADLLTKDADLRVQISQATNTTLRDEKIAQLATLEKSIKLIEDQIATEKASAERINSLTAIAATSGAQAAVGSIKTELDGLKKSAEKELEALKDPFVGTIAGITTALAPLIGEDSVFGKLALAVKKAIEDINTGIDKIYEKAGIPNPRLKEIVKLPDVPGAENKTPPPGGENKDAQQNNTLQDFKSIFADIPYDPKRALKEKAKKDLEEAQKIRDAAENQKEYIKNQIKIKYTDLHKTPTPGAQKLLQDAVDDFNKKQFAYMQALGKYNSFDTGGYTGNFSGGALAVLHEKELVLNKQDTQNILDAVKINKEVLSGIFGGNTKSIPSSIKNGDTANTTIINANFPNVSSSDEIRKAFTNMSNSASQFAYKMRPAF